MAASIDFRGVLHLCLISLLILSSTAAEEDPLSSSSAIARFQQYLRINTAHPNPRYNEAADFILSQAQSLSLESQTLEFVKGKPLILLKWPGSDPNLPSVLLNSHTDVVPTEDDKWVYPPFAAHIDAQGNIYARGSQDTKCIGLQYLEAIRRLKASGFEPVRTIYLSFVPEEETGGYDGAKKLAESDTLKDMNVGIVLDEGLTSPDENYKVFYAERSPWWLVIKATGAPGHGAKLYDNTATENLMKSVEIIRRFRASQFDLVKAGLRADSEVISVNMVFLKAGTPSPTGFVMNLQPSEAEAGFDVRVPPNADPESLERRIAQEWAPASRNMTFEFKQKVPVLDKFGRPVLTATDSSNPWWTLLEEAVKKANGKLDKPQINVGTTDARYFRVRGLPAIGFSPVAYTPILIHDHNEFLNKEEYLKGISIYESIIKAYASYVEHERSGSSKDEL
ncbi:N-acyl-L-amino-acid amidohydrolase [Trema orientale]|uniref:N-acyl-aliphatic-L-amino acid amidohydrolase n=1 Tax=Trema orientale TaxID=63057 RepID=A0A2P5AE45_TREOI|nr:N-acyl-L-amino-acid amidohydrolase [Trema orientale]